MEKHLEKIEERKFILEKGIFFSKKIILHSDNFNLNGHEELVDRLYRKDVPTFELFLYVRDFLSHVLTSESSAYNYDGKHSDNRTAFESNSLSTLADMNEYIIENTKVVDVNDAIVFLNS